MIKILHSADWHLEAPMSGHTPEEVAFLRARLRLIPQQIAKLCTAQNCDMMFLSGDLFDGAASADTVASVQQALKEAAVPVFISPGNHDFIGPDSPYEAAGWPENVHIFKKAAMEEVSLPELDCKIYGAGYQAMDCPGLLKDFLAAGPERYHLGVLHGQTDMATSPYCPITKDQLRSSGLHYLALGHIHKGSSIRAGSTLCAWPGCPMGRGFDELGAKGVIIVTLDEEVRASFLSMDTIRFYDETVEAGDDPFDAVASLLPALPTEDFYRITLTGYSAGVDTDKLTKEFPQVTHLTLRDETRPEMDLWGALGEDTLEGVYFDMLHQAAQSDSALRSGRAKLAARISRQILDGQEVKLP